MEIRNVHVAPTNGLKSKSKIVMDDNACHKCLLGFVLSQVFLGECVNKIIIYHPTERIKSTVRIRHLLVEQHNHNLFSSKLKYHLVCNMQVTE